MSAAVGAVVQRLRSGQFKPFNYPDFRLLWAGAFLSFVGSWIQNVAQGWLVYELTRDPQKLTLISTLSQLPIALFGIFAGAITDMFHKRTLMVITQLSYAFGAIFLAAATHFHFIQYWHILVIALIGGATGAVEMPTRQSIVSRVVPADVVPDAVPLNAMTFNLARVMGPAIGGVLLARFGAETCYFANSLSFLFLVFAALAIKSDLSPREREPQPIKDLLLEGALYTWRDLRLRTLFLMECVVSAFGVMYLSLMPAIAKDMLGLDKAGLGWSMSMIGLGSISGLAALLYLNGKVRRPVLAGFAMFIMGGSLIAMALTRSAAVAFPLFFLTGMAGVMQFNVTNTLFQMLSPDRLRGRVISMHIWALSGMGPITLPIFGWLALRFGLSTALAVGGTAVLLGAVGGWVARGNLAEVS